MELAVLEKNPDIAGPISPSLEEYLTYIAKTGNALYKQLKRNYVVQVPVTVHGVRNNGTTCELKSFFPLERPGMAPTQRSRPPARVRA